MRSPRICRRCASGSARNCDSGQRLSPSCRGACRVELARLTAGATAALGRAGWVRGRRRESIPGGLAAASMRRTLPRTQPARPLTVSGGRPPRKKERRATAGRALRLLAAEHGSALQEHCRTKEKGRGESRVLFLFHQFVRNPMLLPTVTGKLSGVGRCGLAGPLAPWMAPSSPHGRVYGVSCQPTPPRPTISNPEPLQLLTWTLTLPAAGGPPRVSAAAPHPARSGSSRRCHQFRNTRSGSSPDTAGGNPRRSNTPAPGTRSRW